MKFLVIGGTRFLGHHFVEQALAAGHELTLLNRGRSNASLFADVEQRIADRNGDLAVLDEGMKGAGTRWSTSAPTCRGTFER